MESKFLGTGWFSPTKFDASGQLVLATHEQCVEQSLWAILETAPGERVMRPEFGCAIHNLLFANPGAEIIGQISVAVYQAIMRWEPRVEVLGVEVIADEEQINLLKIEIDYRLRTVNSRFNLVYPFYLDSGVLDVE